MSTVKMPSCTIREAESGIITGVVVYAMNFNETELGVDSALETSSHGDGKAGKSGAAHGRKR